MVPDRVGWVRGLTRRSFHRIAFTDWGLAVSDRPVLCVHGLTRNGRDFDYLATVLASRGRRVVCPDLPGRGRSERLKDSSDYVLTQYCRDVDLWKSWDAIDIPILVVRGQKSDLLPEGVLRDMLRRNRNATAHTVENCGHAPALMTQDQIAMVEAFLDGSATR